MIKSESPSSMRWDIFCRLVDNMGDIGVCWRLARDLALHHGCRVVLWLDQPGTFLKLCPSAGQTNEEWFFDSVEVRHWRDPFADVAAHDVADVVIEAFACDPPASYVLAMAQRDAPPLWINLEYLSAEAWVDELHGMTSPHPRLPLTKRFFFPGFSDRTGGLLREPGLFAQRDAFHRDHRAQQAFLKKLGLEATNPEALRISLFAYEQTQLGDLLALWANGKMPVELIVPQGRVLPDVARFLGCDELAVGSCVLRGQLRTHVVPFMSQRDYDLLLWCCQLNFVRGEDSFVRAQWAATAHVWHIYRQDDGAHRVKLEAFLDRYLQGLEECAADAVRQFSLAWNGYGRLAEAWPTFHGVLDALCAHARQWADKQSEFDDLALSLVKLQEVSVK